LASVALVSAGAKANGDIGPAGNGEKASHDFGAVFGFAAGGGDQL
jgi:hypothetical protein